MAASGYREHTCMEVSRLDVGSSDFSPMKIHVKAPYCDFMGSPNFGAVFRPPPGLAPPPGLENRQQFLPTLKAAVPASGPPGILESKVGPPGHFLPRLQRAAYSTAHYRPFPASEKSVNAHSQIEFSQDAASQRKLDRKSLPKGSSRNGKRNPGPAVADDSDIARSQFKEVLTLIQRSNDACQLSLQDVMPHVSKLARDKDGIQFVLTRLDVQDDVKAVCQAVLTETCKLAADVSGSLLIRKLFEVAAAEQSWALAVHLRASVKQLTCDVHGCRVVQTALENVSCDLQVQLAEGLQENIVHCMKNIHGNHVIQKIIEELKPESVIFIMDAINDWGGEKAAVHPYVCRVVMRLLEHCPMQQQTVEIRESILRNVFALSKDRYGNYVVQHILEHGSMEDKQRIIAGCIQGDLQDLARHKYAHNVVEKCMELDEFHRSSVIRSLLSSPVEDLATSRFGAMVAQHILDGSPGSPRELLVQQLRAAEPHLADSETAAPLLQAIHLGAEV